MPGSYDRELPDGMSELARSRSTGSRSLYGDSRTGRNTGEPGFLPGMAD